MHHYQDLISLFKQTFQESNGTILVSGEGEPLYQPRSENCPHHQVIFANGFYQSALHEIAHWCIAGDKRRELVDYGYWYQPDGRSAEQQSIFEGVESKPQAIEWIFSMAAGSRFYVSVDNLAGEATDPTTFKLAIYQRVCHYLSAGLPPQAKFFYEALLKHYGNQPLRVEQFDVEAI
ncbi:MAG: elongation factor P hydroxylase [Gammaproteobacteria bacterium]|nr:elongation factor P hydroxylase [Gammaproteobacteria bacterium]